MVRLQELEAQMRFVNLTPHDLQVVRAGGDGDCITIPASGDICRVSNTPGDFVHSVGGVHVHAPDQPGSLQGLPDPQNGLTFIVSAFCADAVRRTGRRDVLVTATGPGDSPVRKDGRVVAMTRLKMP